MAVKTMDAVAEFKNHPACTKFVRWRDAERALLLRQQEVSAARLEQSRFADEAARLERPALEADSAVLRGGNFEAAQKAREALSTAVAKAQEAGERVADAERALREVEATVQRERAEVGDAAEQLGRHGHQLMEKIMQRKAAGLREVSHADADEQTLAEVMIEVLEKRAGRWFRRMMFGAGRHGGDGVVGLESDGNSGISLWLKEARELGHYDV